MSNALSQAIICLFETERFYAELLASMDRIIDHKLPSCAGVCIKSKIELHINPEKFDVLTLKERAAVLAHECEHILRGHIPRMRELAPEIYAAAEHKKKINREDLDEVAGALADNFLNNKKHRCLNVAADLAINGGMPNLPEWGCFPKDFQLLNGLTFEQYHEALKEQQQQKDKSGADSDEGEYDSHSLWHESEGDREMLKEKIKQAVSKAAKNTRAAGRMTNEHELLVSEILANSVNWREVLRRFVARQLEPTSDTSRKKRNRRYGTMYPGIVKGETRLRLGVACDTSGSMPDISLQQVMSEIAKMSDYADIFVVEADSEIKHAYEFKKQKHYKLYGRGGTAYQPAFDYFEDKGIDALIYFGDMDCYDTEEIKKPKFPVLWAIWGDQAPPASFGSKVYITAKGA
jgi:predicted metal-dependent peptidase